MMLQPEDGVAVVTGGGAGLGRALVLELCRRDFKVIALGRQPKTLEETVSLSDGRAAALKLDVSDFAAVDAVFAQIAKEHGKVALLINNAAVYPRRDLFDETAEQYLATTNINLGGVVACSLAALKSMSVTGRGRILNVATFAGDHPLPGASAYSVSKGAARLFTRAMISDLFDRFPGIVINDWMPGMLKTEMGVPDGLDPKLAAKWGVELALQMNSEFTGSTFEMDKEILPARGIKGKLKDLLLFRRRKPRRL